MGTDAVTCRNAGFISQFFPRLERETDNRILGRICWQVIRFLKSNTVQDKVSVDPALCSYLILSAFPGWLAAPQHQVPDAVRGNEGECLSQGLPRCVLGSQREAFWPSE